MSAKAREMIDENFNGQLDELQEKASEAATALLAGIDLRAIVGELQGDASDVEYARDLLVKLMRDALDIAIEDELEGVL